MDLNYQKKTCGVFAYFNICELMVQTDCIFLWAVFMWIQALECLENREKKAEIGIYSSLL